MSKVIRAAFAAVSAPFLVMLFAPASFAADLTTVTCKAPVSEVATGQDIGSLAPRFTILCTGGSSAGNITYFAFRISDNPTVAQLLEGQLSPDMKSIRILSDLTDTSGNSWGCGGANCRIIAYMYGD
jgi:hypothetical protein